MKHHALSYADRGWHVLPLAPGHKRPACKNGVYDATTDIEDIREWPDKSNIGIACGEVSGIVVLDVDPRNGGHKSLDRLLRRHGELPRTQRVETGGGGEHYYFRYPESGIKKGVVADGLDLVSDGGYVVAPPSLHPSGSHYRWRETRGDRPPPLAELPAWVRAELGNDGGLAGFSLPDLDDIPEGQRNNTFIRIAGAMRRWGLSDRAIEAALQIHNREVCNPPMTEEEVRQIADSATRYEPEVDVGQDESEEGSRVSVEGSPLAS